eukprot:403342506
MGQSQSTVQSFIGFQQTLIEEENQVSYPNISYENTLEYEDKISIDGETSPSFDNIQSNNFETALKSKNNFLTLKDQQIEYIEQIQNHYSQLKGQNLNQNELQSQIQFHQTQAHQQKLRNHSIGHQKTQKESLPYAYPQFYVEEIQTGRPCNNSSNLQLNQVSIEEVKQNQSETKSKPQVLSLKSRISPQIVDQRPPIRKGRPFKNPVITINRKQPEPKDIKSVIRKWRKFMQEDFPQNNKNPNQNLLSVLEQFGLNEQQRLKALLFSQGFHRENCLKNQDGIPIIGSSIKKEITEEREHEDIIGLLISRYNLRRLQKFFKKRIHRVAFRFYEMALSDDFNLLPFPENETLLKALTFIISISDLMETHTP